MLNAALRQLLKDVRPNAVALVDAFEFPDNVLNSALGRYDGKVYEALYEVRCRPVPFSIYAVPCRTV